MFQDSLQGMNLADMRPLASAVSVRKLFDLKAVGGGSLDDLARAGGAAVHAEWSMPVVDGAVPTTELHPCAVKGKGHGASSWGAQGHSGCSSTLPLPLRACGFDKRQWMHFLWRLQSTD